MYLDALVAGVLGAIEPFFLADQLTRVAGFVEAIHQDRESKRQSRVSSSTFCRLKCQYCHWSIGSGNGLVWCRGGPCSLKRGWLIRKLTIGVSTCDFGRRVGFIGLIGTESVSLFA